MSFYGPPKSRLGEIAEHLTAVHDIYEAAGRTVFAADNLVALARNLSFLTDKKFSRAIEEEASDEDDLSKIWRLHTYCWAARSALSLPGDFVECGVFKGFYSATMLEYLDFETVEKQMYLYDTFEGLSDDFSEGFDPPKSLRNLGVCGGRGWD